LLVQPADAIQAGHNLLIECHKCSRREYTGGITSYQVTYSAREAVMLK